MKKYLSILAIILLVVITAIPVNAQADVMLAVRGTTDPILKDSTFPVYVEATNVTGPTYNRYLTAASYTVNYDNTKLQYISITGGTVISGVMTGTEIPIAYNIQPSQGKIYIMNNANGMDGVYGTLRLATVNFKMIDDVATDVTLSDAVLSNKDGTALPMQLINYHIEPDVRGDANLDGQINALDITSIERQAIKLDPVKTSADLNNDGNVDALDVTLVELRIAGLY